jgi:hypothetical protein
MGEAAVQHHGVLADTPCCGMDCGSKQRYDNLTTTTHRSTHQPPGCHACQHSQATLPQNKATTKSEQAR